MQDRLEDFVKANRDAFDEASPRADLWQQIEHKLDGQEEKVKPIQQTERSTLWMWKAAVVLLIGAVAFLAYERFVPRDQVIDPNQVVSTVDEFNELESFYTSLIEEKSDKLSLELEGGEFFNFLEGDIEEIDIIYQELKEAYDNGQETQIVIDRLIHLLRQKLHLINSQLDILEEAKNPVRTKEDETTAI